MPPVGFEPTISAGERPQTYALDRAATGTGIYVVLVGNFFFLPKIRCSLWFPFEGPWTARLLKVGLTDCPEKSVTDYEPTLHNIA